MSTREAELRRLVHALPKAELHVHLEGSIPPDTALRLARRRGVRLPADDEKGLREAYRFRGFGDFIRLYVAISRCFEAVEDFAEAVDAVAVALAEQNVVYAEMTVTPMTHVARGVDPQTVIEGLSEGRARALERGVDLRWVFDIVRSLPDQGAPTLAMAENARDQGVQAVPVVVGLGLGGPESAGTPASLDAVFDRARAAGLASVPHAGELLGAESVRAAVERLGARRIGHGVRCLEDPAVVALLIERGVKLEVCPWSNVRLGVCARLEDHPLPRLLEAGLELSLGSDDPALFGTTLVDEYVRSAMAFGWDDATLIQLIGAPVEHAVCDEERRAELRGLQREALAATRDAPA